jgi:hypothetical protein
VTLRLLILQDQRKYQQVGPNSMCLLAKSIFYNPLWSGFEVHHKERYRFCRHGGRRNHILVLCYEIHTMTIKEPSKILGIGKWDVAQRSNLQLSIEHLPTSEHLSKRLRHKEVAKSSSSILSLIERKRDKNMMLSIRESNPGLPRVTRFYS